MSSIRIPYNEILVRYPTGQFMGTDSGYPYPTEFNRAAQFSSISQVLDYIDHFPDTEWEILPIKSITIEIDDNKSAEKAIKLRDQRKIIQAQLDAIDKELKNG